MDNMKINSAQYVDSDNAIVKAIINGDEMFVPLDPANRHYAEIQKQVKEGKLTIKDAD